MLASHERRKKRELRVRKNLRGTLARPRLCVVKTNKHLHVQIIDDEKAQTLIAGSTFGKKAQNFDKKNKENAKKLGTHIATLAKEKGIQKVIFDRGCSKFHGVLAEFAKGAREAGLEF